MAVASSPERQSDVELQLKETGNRLVHQSLSVDELLPLLDRVETYLSRVEQSPPKSMLDALSLSMNALVEDQFLKHSDVDVKVAVASCISEITRITAPDAPYDDDKMKDVFHLIVSSFEDLSDQSSRSYAKRASILETVAKVRSCVVMLDLECEGLIAEMFQHFLKAIRDYHPENVFSSMETIMTLVIEESEDISLELLTPILASVKMENEEVMPVARKLGEKVLEKAAEKLKPYLVQTVKSLGVSLEDYSQVVTLICNETSGAIEKNDDNASVQPAEEIKVSKAFSDEATQADESKLTTASSEETAQVEKENVTDVPCPEEDDPAVDRSPKSVMSNGIMETGNEETSVDQESTKKLEQEPPTNETLNVDLPNKVDTDDSDAGKLIKSEPKLEQTTKKRGRKSSAITNSTEPSDSILADSEKEAEKLPDRRKSRSKDARSSPGEDLPIEAATPSENENDASTLPDSPKALVSEIAKATSSSPSGSLPDDSRLKKGGRAKKKQSLAQVDVPSVDTVPTKTPEGTSDSEAKQQRRLGKKGQAGISKEDKIAADVKSKSESISDSEEKILKLSAKKVDAGDEGAKPLRQSIKKGEAGDSEAKSLRQSGKKGLTILEPKPVPQTTKKGDASSSEAKLQKQSGKKGNTSKSVEHKSSLKKEDGKKRRRGQDATEKDLAKSFAEEEMVSSPRSKTKLAKEEDNIEEPNTSSKRKRTPGKEKASESAADGDKLIGSKIKVWWPKDHAFYDGVIKSYDPVKKKHTVLYTDDEVEILNLQKERWEFLGGGSLADGEQATEDSSPNVSSETHSKKKKAKTESEPPLVQDIMEISPIRVGVASSSKLKGSASKSGRKSKVEGKVDSKSKDNASKAGGKSEDDKSGKSKDRSHKSSDKSVGESSIPKSGVKSKDIVGTPKTATKSKQDASKTVNKPKGKTPQGGNKSSAKSSANGSGKMKLNSSKVMKESEDEEENSAYSEKTTEDVKVKSPDTTSKARVSGSKSGKKRKKRS